VGKKKHKIGKCTYCQENKVVTREHVIPRCLFPKPLPNFMITVPVCQTCNRKKGRLDEYLRDVLVLDIDSSENEAAQKLKRGEVNRAIRRNRSEVMRTARTKAKLEPRYTPGGIYLGHAVSFPIDSDKLNQAFAMIVRGLHFAVKTVYLPNDCTFDIRRVHPLEFNETWDAIKKTGFNGPYRLGDNIFTALMIFAAEEPALTLWWLWFYESICVYVATSPQNFDQEASTSKAT
jgi:hypothetical protein